MFGLFKKKKHYQIDAVFKKLPGVAEYPGIFLINTKTGETLTNPNTDADDNLFLPVEADAYIHQLMKEAIDNKNADVSLTEMDV